MTDASDLKTVEIAELAEALGLQSAELLSGRKTLHVAVAAEELGETISRKLLGAEMILHVAEPMVGESSDDSQAG